MRVCRPLKSVIFVNRLFFFKFQVPGSLIPRVYIVILLLTLCPVGIYPCGHYDVLPPLRLLLVPEATLIGPSHRNTCKPCMGRGSIALECGDCSQSKSKGCKGMIEYTKKHVHNL